MFDIIRYTKDKVDESINKLDVIIIAIVLLTTR